MNMLATLTSDETIANEKDSVGGSSFGPVESGLYNCVVEHAFVAKSNGGALGLNLQLRTDKGQILRETLWMTSGTAKGGKNYYEKDGKKNYLPGFLMAQSLALLTTSQEISALETESKVIKQYSAEAKAEVPTQVNMVMDLVGKEVIAGVLKQIQDKNVKADDGSYVPSGETREANVLDKFFRASDRKTTAEIRAKEDAAFIDTWADKHTGKVYDKSTKDAGTAGAPKRTAAPAASGAKKPTASLFG